jgi:hypothetical protein
MDSEKELSKFCSAAELGGEIMSPRLREWIREKLNNISETNSPTSPLSTNLGCTGDIRSGGKTWSEVSVS